jgi:serine/threonine protein kinase
MPIDPKFAKDTIAQDVETPPPLPFIPPMPPPSDRQTTSVKPKYGDTPISRTVVPLSHISSGSANAVPSIAAVVPKLRTPSQQAMRETRINEEGRPNWADMEVFRAMNAIAIEELREVMEACKFANGETIMAQGEVADAMYLLDQGEVRVRINVPATDTFFERVLTAPALFGEMALITAGPRNASVTAETEVRCLRVSRAAFDDLVQKNPHIAAFLTRAVGDRLLESQSIQHVGKYQVVGRLGAGAVATVFEAVHPGLGRNVALKMLSHALVFHPKFARQFQEEAKLVAKLDHENIVRVYDTEKAYGTHFIVMEKLSGLTLDDVIRKKTQLNWGTVRRILREIASALAYSHARGLLHRDIKPSNVFLTADDRRVKLLDFGIAVSQEASAHGGNTLMGTPYYMSPEQILGNMLDGRSDLYSLGILAYELVVHDVPFDAETIEDLLEMHLSAPTPDPRLRVADLPDDLREFILKATEKKSTDRFTSCAEAVAFLQLAADLPVVHRIELSTVAISYHPSRRQMVADALADLEQRLAHQAGVTLLHAHQTANEPKEV